MFPIDQYHRASSVEHACSLLAEYPGRKLIAGGTDVLIRLREGKSGFSSLIDIHDLDELTWINHTADGTLQIGSGVTFTQLINYLKNDSLLPALVEGSSSIGGPQVRNMATLGGNICNGATSADSAAPLLAFNARITLKSQSGTREVPVEDFYAGPGKVHLEPDEIVTTFSINQEDHQNTGSHFYKYAMRKAMDIATIGCAAVCRIEENRIQSLRLAYTVAAPVPTRCHVLEEQVNGQPVSGKLIRDIAAMVLEELSPRNSWRASKDFREHIIRTLADRVVTEAIIRAGGQL
ncbi:xanthine dehydrogenase subunit XdhB [Endozoicomonas sp.]|uniref:xanthine dehydrogenase subunit XdhB n=1 Tax=Endozoicomonas sp. TaxID=1892382 RepID=UPI00288419FF|nr:xanthine dehydrogenase FAD-binding subunit XdhB [Endozoicomonas sp.]